jgi:signal transduction histidine kinase
MKLGELSRQVANEVDSATHRRCPIVVEVADDAGREVAVDPSIIRHIFVNLLSNAVKYSEPNVPVLFKLRREGADAIIVVRDEGIGIPAADQARLFQAFKRGSNSGSTPGTGIGLVIVKRCVEVLHGRIDIESKEQEGTVVTVCLPLYEEPAETRPT